MMAMAMCNQYWYNRLRANAKIAMITSRMGSIADNTSGGRYGYRMSKTALNMASTSLAVDLKPRGIAVGIFHPGRVATDMLGPDAKVGVNDTVDTTTSATNLLSIAYALLFSICTCIVLTCCHNIIITNRTICGAQPRYNRTICSCEWTNITMVNNGKQRSVNTTQQQHISHHSLSFIYLSLSLLHVNALYIHQSTRSSSRFER
jgi:hypothetical protein